MTAFFVRQETVWRKHRGTDRVEVLSDAALFEINIKNIYQCEKIEEIIEKFHYNNPVYKREKYILYSEVGSSERKRAD